MTNEELAELEREARHEMDIFDRPSIRTSLRLIEAIATAREAEALRAENARLREALEEAEWVPLSQDDAETELWLCLRDMFHPTDDKSLIAEMRKRSLWVYARADRTADEDEENPNAG